MIKDLEVKHGKIQRRNGRVDFAIRIEGWVVFKRVDTYYKVKLIQNYEMDETKITPDEVVGAMERFIFESKNIERLWKLSDSILYNLEGDRVISAEVIEL